MSTAEIPMQARAREPFDEDDGKAGSKSWVFQQMEKAGPFAVLLAVFVFAGLSGAAAVGGVLIWAVQQTVPAVVKAAKEISDSQQAMKTTLAAMETQLRASHDMIREDKEQGQKVQDVLEQIRDKINRRDEYPKVNESTGGYSDGKSKPVGTEGPLGQGVFGAGK